MESPKNWTVFGIFLKPLPFVTILFFLFIKNIYILCFRHNCIPAWILMTLLLYEAKLLFLFSNCTEESFEPKSKRLVVSLTVPTDRFLYISLQHSSVVCVNGISDTFWFCIYLHCRQEMANGGRGVLQETKPRHLSTEIIMAFPRIILHLHFVAAQSVICFWRKGS